MHKSKSPTPFEEPLMERQDDQAGDLLSITTPSAPGPATSHSESGSQSDQAEDDAVVQDLINTGALLQWRMLRVTIHCVAGSGSDSVSSTPHGYNSLFL